jgi:hypothetical protein
MDGSGSQQVPATNQWHEPSTMDRPVHEKKPTKHYDPAKEVEEAQEV